MCILADVANRLVRRDSSSESTVEPSQAQSAVAQLQAYLLGTSYIKVFSLEDHANGSKDHDTVRNLRFYDYACVEIGVRL
jgi:hypothetical protein